MPATLIDPKLVQKLYVEDRLSTNEIAHRTGFSIAGIRQSLLRNGVELRSRADAHEGRAKKAFGFVPTKEWLQEAMAASGGNALACSEHYGFSYPTFVDVLRRNGIPRLPPQRRRVVEPPFPVDEAAMLSSSGVPYDEIAKKYDVTYAVVMYHLKKAGHVSPKNKQKKWEGRTLPTNKWVLLQDLKTERGPGCEICKLDRSITLCHIYANKHGGPLVKDNVILLCPNHHDFFDKGKLTQEEFSPIKERVRIAEKLYGFQLGFYGEW